MKLFSLILLLAVTATAQARELHYDCEAHVQSINPMYIDKSTEQAFTMNVEVSETPFSPAASVEQTLNFGAYGPATFNLNPQTFETTYMINAVLHGPNGEAVASVHPQGTSLLLKDGGNYLVVTCELKTSTPEKTITWDPLPHPVKAQP